MTSRRKVLVTADAVGGVWTYATDVSSGLCALGDDVTLAVLGPSASAAQHRAARAAGLDPFDTGLPPEWLAETPTALRRASEALVDLAVAQGADIVHLSSPALAGLARFPMAVTGVAHSCLATWWQAVRTGDPPPDIAWRIAATARGYSACQALIAPSKTFAEATRLIYGVSPITVHNGRRRPPATGLLRDIAVTTAGRLWDEGKGAATLDAAAGMLDVVVRALGPTVGPQGQSVCLQRLHLVGLSSAAAMARTLARTRIFVSAARYEPFGLAVLEAAQAGCALVLSDIATFRELWADAAVFVPPGDAAGFAAALKTLLDDPAATARLASVAESRAQRYELDRCVKAVRDIHKTMLARSGKAA